jgi:hypothetical protein
MTLDPLYSQIGLFILLTAAFWIGIHVLFKKNPPDHNDLPTFSRSAMTSDEYQYVVSIKRQRNRAWQKVALVLPSVIAPIAASLLVFMITSTFGWLLLTILLVFVLLAAAALH